MTTPPPTRIVKDLANRKLIIHRTFLGPIDLVWRAWTEKDLLEQWWAPKPFKAVTKSYDFREGGHWL
ncbi:MAG: SRPBCC domain-containing protein, partial [Bacteroidia bacterium]|nr:SRPBCC domain-containing protein [Bacteroidia bacterium]